MHTLEHNIQLDTHTIKHAPYLYTHTTYTDKVHNDSLIELTTMYYLFFARICIYF